MVTDQAGSGSGAFPPHPRQSLGICGGCCCCQNPAWVLGCLGSWLTWYLLFWSTFGLCLSRCWCENDSLQVYNSFVNQSIYPVYLYHSVQFLLSKLRRCCMESFQESWLSLLFPQEYVPVRLLSLRTALLHVVAAGMTFFIWQPTLFVSSSNLLL